MNYDGYQGLYYLQNLQAGYLGNSPMFWAKGGKGYTQWLDKCERFSREEVMRHVEHDPSKWRAWKCDVVDSFAQRTVDIQKLFGHQETGDAEHVHIPARKDASV